MRSTIAFFLLFTFLTTALLYTLSSIADEGAAMYYWEAKRRMKYIQLGEQIHYARTGRYTADTLTLRRIIDSFLVRKSPPELYKYTENTYLPLTVDSVWHNPCTQLDFLIEVDTTGQLYQIRDPDWREYGYIGSWGDRRLFDKARWEEAL